MDIIAIFDGWFICKAWDGYYVRDDAITVAGPLRSRADAAAAARKLPKRRF